MEVRSNPKCVLLHGIGKSRSHMAHLQESLEAKGIRVYNVEYPSRRLSIEACAQFLAQGPLKSIAEPDEEVDFLVHSMGGLVLRYFNQFYAPFRLGKVVMLGTPNHGSELCDVFGQQLWYKWWFGPAGRQLGTSPKSFPQQLGELDFECGVIAGDQSSWLTRRWIPELNDGRVSVESTKLDDMLDFKCVKVGHNEMLKNREVFRHALHFLQHGWFEKTHG